MSRKDATARPPLAVPQVKDPFLPPRRPGGAAGDAPARLAPDPVEAVASGTLRGDEAAPKHERQPDARGDAGSGSLVVVGAGIMATDHMTLAGRRWIERSDRVLYFGADPVTERWLGTCNADLVSLRGIAVRNGPAMPAGNEIAERVLDYVRAGLTVCAVCDGRTGAFADALHETMAKCRAEGYRAAILPGISPQACLVADLELDLLRIGCQIFDGCDFLAAGRQPDTSAGLILSLANLAGDAGARVCHHSALAEALLKAYGPDHEVFLHEPAPYPVCDPLIRRFPLGQLAEAAITAMSSLYVPPKAARAPDAP